MSKNGQKAPKKVTKERILKAKGASTRSKENSRKLDALSSSLLGSRQYLGLFNGYLHSLLNPFGVTGVKIPDFDSTRTTTFSTIDRFSFPVGSGGAFWINVQIGPPLLSDYGTSVGNTLIQYSPNAVTSYFNDNGAVGYTQLGYSAGSQMVANYARIRPVSAGLMVMYAGSTLSDAGLMLASYTDGESNGTYYENDNVWTFGYMQSFPNTETVLINQCRAIMCRYIPLTYDHYQYTEPNSLQTAINDPTDDPVGYQLSINPPLNYGYLMAAGQGLAVGAPIYAVLRINWEATPLVNTFVAGAASASPVDHLALENAMSMSSNTSPVRALPNASDTFIMSGPSGHVMDDNYPQYPVGSHIVQSLAAQEGTGKISKSEATPLAEKVSEKVEPPTSPFDNLLGAATSGLTSVAKQLGSMALDAAPELLTMLLA